MPDTRFYQKAGPFTAQELATLVGAELVGDAAAAARTFMDVAPLDVAGEQHVSFLDNPKYVDNFRNSTAGACIVRPKHRGEAPEGMVLFVTDEPYLAYAKVASRFYPVARGAVGVSPHAHVASTATIGKECIVSSGAVVGERCVIGDRCYIGPNAVIGDGVIIGEGASIGAGATIAYAIIGNRVILHPAVCIGQDGFGFAGSPEGLFKVPQLGKVIIEDDVEIGANSCVDRGSGPDTVIGAGTKIDNLVQIAHNTRVGKHCIIVAQVGIAGSTVIGDGAVIGGQAGIVGHIKIGRGVRIAAQSGVIEDVPAGVSVGGYPAIPTKEWHRQTLVLRRLSRKARQEHE